MTLVLLLQIPMVQTYIAKKVVASLSEKIDGNITFEKVHFKPFSHLVLKNVVITDDHPYTDPSDPNCVRVDTLLCAKYLIADFSLTGLIGHEGIHLDQISLYDAKLNLVIEDKENGETTTNLARIFKLDEIQEEESSDKELFFIKKVKADNFAFMMKNYSQEKAPYYDGGIDWNDLHVNDVFIDVSNLQFKAGTMSGRVNDMSFTEKSGYICNSLTGSAEVSNNLTHLTDIELIDPWSEIRMPEGKLIYTGAADFSDYIHKVVMDAEIGTSTVDFTTISYFAPQLKGNTLRLNAYQGRYHGTVNDFTIEDLHVAMEGGGFSGIVNGRMTGIPEVMTTTIKGNIRNGRLTTKGLSKFVTHWMPTGNLDLTDLAPNKVFNISGDVNGTLNNMVVQPVITSSLGSARGTDIRIDNILETNAPIAISGEIKTDDLDLGGILGTDLLGPTTLTLNASAAFGAEDAPITADIHSLVVDRLHLYGYDYTNISGEAVVSEKYIDGRLACDDPNLHFITQGRYGISRNNNDAKYDFAVVVGDADLNKINLDKRGKSKTRFTLKADFTQKPSNDIFGDIVIKDLWLENDNGAYNIGDIHLNSINRANSTYKMELTSSFAEGLLVGTAPVTEFIKDILGITVKKELPALFKDSSYEWSGNRYQLNFNFGNTQDILAWAVPGMYLAQNTTLKVDLNDYGRLNASLNSQRVAYNKNYLMDVSLNLNNNDETISGELTGSELKLATMSLNDNSVTFLVDDNHIGAAYRYENNSDLENRGEFVIHGDLARDNEGISMDIKLLPSTVFLNSREWRIKPSHISLHEDGIKESSIELVSNEQAIHMHGGTSLSKTDTLHLNLEQFDMSIINPLFKTDLGIRGITSGEVQLTSPLTEKGILVDLTCDSAYFADQKIGRINVSSEWDEAFQRFNISANTEMDGRTTVDARARLTPKTKNLEAYAKLDRVHVGYLQPLMEGVLSDIQGYVSGELSAEGPIDNLEWESHNTRLEEGELRVDFTNVPYFVEGDFTFNDTGLYFDNITGRDRYDGTGNVTGGITWNNKFENIYYDITINCNQLEGIDLNDKQNEYFYGNVFGTGTVTFTGPDSDMVMNVEGSTAKSGTFHVPISYTSVSGQSNLLKFTEITVEKPVDPYDVIIAKMEQNNATTSKFTTNMKINALPEVEAFIWIDKTSGHMLSGHGNGTLNMTIDEEIFDITGDYNIIDGNYKFVAYGVVNRDFQIQDGSSITFVGDIFDSTLDIDAMYKTKASIGTLIGDTTAVSNRRTVECKIKITDKMMNPRLQFGIEIPEIDPTIKSRVESALSTEDKVQKQFLSLLLSNSFLPDEQSGIVNNSTMLYSNVSEVMASQLNNILEKLNIPIDLGLNYQPNDKGNDVFDVAVSTQMFNNRVVVNGSVGNKQYTENAQTDVVGDLDIEIKLNKSGAFRLNLFSHSADSYTNYLDNSQRNGVGLTYQTEFSTFRQFIKNIFSSKKKRQEAKQAEEDAKIGEEREVLKIE